MKNNQIKTSYIGKIAGHSMEKDATIEQENHVAYLKTIMDKYHHGTFEEQKGSKDALLKFMDGFITYAIHKYTPTFYEEYHSQLYNECVVAILENMGKYDPEKSAPTTFFIYPIKRALSSFTNSVTNKTSFYVSNNMNKVRRAITQMQADGKECTEADIALHTGMTVKSVKDSLSYITMADELGCGSSEDFENVLTKWQDDPETSYLKQELSEILYHALMSLPKKDMMILLYRYGFLEDGKPLSFNKIAAKMGVSANQAKRSNYRSLSILSKNTQLHEYYMTKSA